MSFWESTFQWLFLMFSIFRFCLFGAIPSFSFERSGFSQFGRLQRSSKLSTLVGSDPWKTEIDELRKLVTSSVHVILLLHGVWFKFNKISIFWKKETYLSQEITPQDLSECICFGHFIGRCWILTWLNLLNHFPWCNPKDQMLERLERKQNQDTESTPSPLATSLFVRRFFVVNIILP